MKSWVEPLALFQVSAKAHDVIERIGLLQDEGHAAGGRIGIDSMHLDL